MLGVQHVLGGVLGKILNLVRFLKGVSQPQLILNTVLKAVF